MAHMWKFKRDCTPTREDEHTLLSGETLPPYIIQFIHHLQEKQDEEAHRTR